MNVPNRERERRDWSLVIFIIPLGIILIIIVGQLAIRLFPNWTVNADMRSNLDPNTAPGQPASLLQPLLPQILTPMAWAESYLTPGAGGDISFPPFIILEPTGTPSPTPVSPTPTTATPTATTPSPTSTITVTPTATDDDDDNTPNPPATCQNPAATNFGGSLPCVFPPTTCQDNTATNFGDPLPCIYPPTCQDNTALNFGDPLPCVYPPPTTCQDNTATNFGDPLPCIYGYPSTIDSAYGTPVTPPSEIGIGTGPDNDIGEVESGTYIVLPLNIVVNSTPDENYDLIYYEHNSGGGNYVFLDWVIIGISEYADGSVYYEVFNWGNNIPDTNTNVDTNTLPPDSDCAGNLECDNREIPTSDLHPSPEGTGILIDVDNAPSAPPPGNYDYIVIISPINGGSNDPVQVDAVVVTEVPLATP